MRSERGLAEEIQRYLDGEPVQLDETARAEAAHFEQALAAYTASLRPPGPEVDRAVMAVIGARRSPARKRALRWFLEPQAVRVRPALAAALAVAVVGLTWTLARQDQRSSSRQVVAQETAASEAVLVRFELRAPRAERVAVAGSFSQWDERGIPLTRNAETGVWTVTLPLPPGEYQYLFLIDGQQWVPDPAAHAQVDDGFGQRNSVIVVGPRGVVRS